MYLYDQESYNVGLRWRKQSRFCHNEAFAWLLQVKSTSWRDCDCYSINFISNARGSNNVVIAIVMPGPTGSKLNRELHNSTKLTVGE